MNREKYLYYIIYLLIALPLVKTVSKVLLETFSPLQTFTISMILACDVYHLIYHVLRGFIEKNNRR